MYSYYTYGLNIQSILILPGLMSGKSGKFDLTISMGKVEDLPLEVAEIDHELIFWNTPDQFITISKQVGVILARNGNEIIVDSISGIENHQLASIVLDIALPAILHQRGLLVLHASAVTVGDAAVAFLGKSGEGKSTMAVAMHTYGQTVASDRTRGSKILTDDMVALELNTEGDPLVFAGFPQVRLLPETVTAIDGVAKYLSPEKDFLTGKHICSNDLWLPIEPVPLKRIYVLAEGEEQTIERLPPQTAFLELMRNFYGQALVQSKDAATLQFHRYTKLLRRIPVYCLRRPRSLSQIPDLVRLVEKDCSQIEHEKLEKETLLKAHLL